MISICKRVRHEFQAVAIFQIVMTSWTINKNVSTRNSVSLPLKWMCTIYPSTTFVDEIECVKFALFKWMQA